MSAFSRLASGLRSLPSWAARYLDNRLAAIEDSVAGLASDGTFTMSSAAVNKVVYGSAADTVALADADDAAKNKVVGFTVSAPTGSTAVVRFVGIVTAAGSFTAWAPQYASAATPGALTATAPAAPYAIPVGIAINTTDLLVLPSGLLTSVLRALGVMNGTREIGIKLGDWRIVSATGDVGDIAAIGGVLASNSDPILLGEATTNSWAISWAANSVVPIGVEVSIPADLDDTADVTLTLSVSSGTTNAATMGVASSWDGGSEITDSADDSSTKSATRHLITATIAAADIPASATHLTLRLTPPAHSTNGILLFAAKLSYTPKAV